jgi:hypothetical protein
MGILLPGWQYKDLGPDGGPYDEMKHPKVCIHTTEGTTLEGAESAYRQYPPHLGYDPMRRIRRQYVSLDRHSYSLKGAESDDEYVIQVEVVGFASQTHMWSDEIYRNFGEDVIIPLRRAINIPDRHLRFFRQDEGIILAREDSPIRLSNTQFREFSGWLGHQHVPSPDHHWDPGGFLIDKARQTKEVDMNWEQDRRQYNADRVLSAMLNNEDTVTGIQPFWSGWSAGTGTPPAKVSIPNPVTKRIKDIEKAVQSISTKLDELLTQKTNLIGSGQITFTPTQSPPVSDRPL